MAKFGHISIIVGLIVTIFTFVIGFGLMFYGGYDAWVKLLLMLVPVGFLILFTGVATVTLFSPEERSKD